jgi:O-methyltransferase
MSDISSKLSRFKNSVAARAAYPMVRKVRAKGLTYLSNARLISLSRYVNDAIRLRPEPLLVEFGVALGGSAILMTEALSRAQRGSFVGYDMFGMIPAPSASDEKDAHSRYADIASGRSQGIKGAGYYGYEPDLLSKVRQSFAEFGLTDASRFELIAGDFRQTFVSPLRPIDVMHIDCDWHDSVVFCLEAAQRHLRTGGVILVDDYNDYKGCKAAVDEFLRSRASGFTLVSNQSHAVIKRTA